MFKTPLLPLILLLLFAGEGNQAVPWPQSKTQSEEITAEEIREAQQTAKRFRERLGETRDLRPIIKEMFATGFIKGALKDSFLMGTMGLPRGYPEQASQEELLSYYALEFSIQYELREFLAGKVSMEKEGITKSLELLPQNLKDYMKGIEEPKGLKPVEHIRFISEADEKTLALLKDYLGKNPPEGTAQYRRNLAAFADHLNDKSNDWGKPATFTLEEERFGYPTGTRFIRMEIPFHLGLILVREKGQLKILFAISVIPPD